MLGCAIEVMGESFSLVRKYGVPADMFYGVMTDGLFACWAYKTYGKFIVDEKYLPAGQRALNGLKDANLALAAGEAVGVPLPSGNVWRDRLVGAVAHGEGEHDWAVMAKDQARASGLVKLRERSGGGEPGKGRMLALWEKWASILRQPETGMGFRLLQLVDGLRRAAPMIGGTPRKCASSATFERGEMSASCRSGDDRQCMGGGISMRPDRVSTARW